MSSPGQQKKSRNQKKKRKADNVEADKEGDGKLFNVEEVVAHTMKNGIDYYKIKWEGYKEMTWEPEENLCAGVLADARAVRMRKDDKLLAAYTESTPIVNESKPKASEEQPATKRPKPRLETSHGSSYLDPVDWSRGGQVEYRDIERIHVHENAGTVKQRVTDARLSGIPVCLTGHKGWAQFAKRWLDRTGNDGELGDATSSETQANNKELLDLSKPHRVNIQKMLEHIGDEPVPIRHKTQKIVEDPQTRLISLRTYLQKCWEPSNTGQSNHDASKLYLHQWQFPMSRTALKKMCGPGNNVDLPYNILGDDLLRYWHEEEAYLGDNPYQYIFMGRKGTMSQLHSDKGGLLITIAPIVGEKEVVLVHRADGATCMYHLDAELDRPDLNRFPLMTSARVWRTILKPGEILVMPQGTYHQCRNVSDCLSYSRFILDEVNLRAFLESYFDEDANEIEHGQVIWNASHELSSKLDAYTLSIRTEYKTNGAILPYDKLPKDVIQVLSSLRALRGLCREIGRRNVVKHYQRRDWDDMVNVIDRSTHAFRYRYSSGPPAFRTKEFPSAIDFSLPSAEGGGQSKDHTIRLCDTPKYHDAVHALFSSSPKLSLPERFGSITDTIRVLEGDSVSVKASGRKLTGKILRREDYIEAAFIHYDNFDECYDELVPLSSLRLNVACGESSAQVRLQDIGEGSAVYYNESGKKYRATVKSIRCNNLYLIELQAPWGFADLKRWFCRESILSRKG